MRLLSLRHLGLNLRYTPLSFAVPNVAKRLKKLKRFGSIDDRPSLPLTIVASGKSFTNVTVARHGGLGVAIAPPTHLSLLSQILKMKAMTQAQILICCFRSEVKV